MKYFVLFENKKFISKTTEKEYCNLDLLDDEHFDKSKCEYIEVDCDDNDYAYYENDEIKIKPFDKEINKEIIEEDKTRFNYVEPVDETVELKKENETLKEELEGLKGIVNKLVKNPSFKNFKETIA